MSIWDRGVIVRSRYLWVALLFGASACASSPEGALTPSAVSTLSSDEEVPTSGEPQARTICIDNDDDGFGEHCRLGADCDDNDASIGSECTLTASSCEPGSDPVPCYKVVGFTTDRITCGEGVRNCIGGLLSHCNVEKEMVFPANISALITGPDGCNVCEPQCNYTQDLPTSADLTADNSEDVIYDATEGGVTLDKGLSTGTYDDTDGDGVPDDYDPFETDPERNDHTEKGNKFYILPYGEPAIYDPFDVDLQLNTADIYFLMDTTASMQGEIDNLTSALVSGNYITNPEECDLQDQAITIGDWTADFYPNTSLSGAPDFSRAVTDVNLSSSDGTLQDNGGSNWRGSNFSIQFRQTLEVPAAAAGTFRFTIASDDGKRLFIDGVQVPLINTSDGIGTLDTWRWRGSQDFYADIVLAAGSHELRIDYNQGSGPWFIRTELNTPGVAGYEGLVGAMRCTIPNASFGVGYFDDIPRRDYGYPSLDDFCHDPVYGTPHDMPFNQLLPITSADTQVDRDQILDAVQRLSAQCGLDGPESQIPALYALTTGAEIPDTDNDNDYDQTGVESVTSTPWGIHEWLTLESGSPPVSTGPTVPPCEPPTSWNAEYWNNKTLSGSPVLTRSEASIQNSWGSGGPGSPVNNNNFSARWTGTFSHTGGNCGIRFRSDDGMRTKIDGVTVLESWRDQGATTYSALVNISAGTHTLEVEYYENSGGAVAQFWLLDENAYSATSSFDIDFDIGDVSQEMRAFSGDTSTASSTSYSAGCSAKSSVGDHVYQFSVSEEKEIVISTVGSSYRTRVNVLDEARNRITCDDDNYSLDTDSRTYIRRTYQPGTYYVVIDGKNGSDVGPYQLMIGPTQGNRREGATDLGTLDGRWLKVRGSTSYFGDVYSNGSCYGGGSTTARDNVLTFNVSEAMNFIAHGYDDSLRLTLRLLDENFNTLYCNNGSGDRAAIFQRLQPGTYHVMIEGSTNKNGNYRVGMGAWPDSDSVWTPEASGCTGDSWGYACFRKGTIPIVIMFTDNEMHNGVNGSGGADDTYNRNTPAYNDAIYAMRQQGMKFIGIHSGDKARDRCRRDCIEREYYEECADEEYTECGVDPGRYYSCETVERCLQGVCFYDEECRWRNFDCPPGHVVTGTRNRCRTKNRCIAQGPEYCYKEYRESESDLRDLGVSIGSVNDSGDPFVYQIESNGAGLGATVVDAVAELSRASRVDVSLQLNDNPATPDVDEREFVKSLSTVTAPLNPGDPVPETNTRCLEVNDTWYRKCLPGTAVRFNLSLGNDFVPPAAVDQTFTFEVDLVGDGRYSLKTFTVTVVVPADTALYPEEGRYWRDVDSADACVDQLPSWERFEFEANFPDDSTIEWQAYLAASEAELDTVTPITWTSPDLASPITFAPEVINAGLSRRRYLRLMAVLKSSTDRLSAPVLQSLDIRFTCIDDS